MSQSVPPAGELATVEIVPGRRIMRLAFAEDFEQRPVEEQRHAVAHELVHVLHRNIYDSARAIQDELGGSAYRVFIAHIEYEIERAVDTVAGIVAVTLPLS